MSYRTYRITLLTVVVSTLLIAVCSLGIGRFSLSPWRIVQILVEPLSGNDLLFGKNRCLAISNGKWCGACAYPACY